MCHKHEMRGGPVDIKLCAHPHILTPPHTHHSVPGTIKNEEQNVNSEGRYRQVSPQEDR